MNELQNINMSMKDIVTTIASRGAPYIGTCFFTREFVLVDYDENKVLKACASISLPLWVAEEFMCSWGLFLCRLPIPDSIYVYYDSWRPDNDNYKNLTEHEVNNLKALGFIEF